MRNHIIFSIAVIVFLNSCVSSNKTPALKDTPGKGVALKADTALSFEQRMYYKTDKIYSGPVYEDTDHASVFYRLLEMPEEENITLYAEKISVGDEGGKYQLVKRIRLTDDNAVLPKFGLSKIDSVKFTDSVTVSGYFNDKKQRINLSRY